jgi:hypothetical protein
VRCEPPTAPEGRFHLTAATASLFLSKLIKLYVRSGARSNTRCTFSLARHLRSLQAVPIAIDRRRLFVDLRTACRMRCSLSRAWSARLRPAWNSYLDSSTDRRLEWGAPDSQSPATVKGTTRGPIN